jgi:deoxyribose-phosphate aldolase
MAVKLQDTEDAIVAGAAEIDMVIDRGAFLSGRLIEVFEEIVAIREVCGDRAHLKVILETGELVTLDNVRKASYLAMLAGADFIKTSTGKIQQAATMQVTYTMLMAIKDYFDKTGIMIGMKPAGGISTSLATSLRLVSITKSSLFCGRNGTFRSRSSGSAAPGTPFLTAIIASIKRKPSNASRAYLTSPGKTAAKSCSTKARVSAAPPRTIGHFSAKPRLVISSKFSFIITVDLTSSPLIPIASTSEA